MIVTALYINDSLMDLYPNTVVAISVQSLNVGDLAVRKVSHTNNFKIPWTPNNANILGFAYDENSDTEVLHSVQSGRLVQNGIEIIRDANVHVVKSGTKQCSIQIYENVSNFFAEIKDKTLAEIAPISVSGWEASHIDSARTNTSGIISAVVCWKEGVIYDVNFFLPSFFYHTFITSILEFTGLTLAGDILTDARFTDLIVPYFKDDLLYPNSFYSSHAHYEEITVPQVRTNEVNSEYSWLAHIATENTHGTYFVHCAVGGIGWNGGTNLILRVKKNGVVVGTPVTIATNPAPGGIADFEYTDFFEPGDTVDCYVYSDDMAAPGTDYTVATGGYIRFVPSGKVNRNSVTWNELFHEVKAIDFIKDFFTRFAIIPKQTGSVLTLKTLEEIIADKTGALDWSSKLVNVDDQEIDPETTYAQNNNFNYSDSLSDSDYGRGVLEIANNKLALDKTVFTSAFENTRGTQIVETSLAIIPVFDTDSVDLWDFADGPGLKLLTIRDRVDESAITFNATPRTDYQIGYFVDSDQSKDTGFQYFLDEFYPSLTSALQKSKTITKYFNLSEIDIQGYDPHKLIGVNGNYYLPPTIKNFIPGRVTKVELFKVQ